MLNGKMRFLNDREGEQNKRDGNMKIGRLLHVGVLAVVLAVVLGLGTTASAGALFGTWSGVVFVDGKDTPVELTIEHSSASIHFLSPYNCIIELERPMVDEDAAYMAGVDNCSGGRCDEMWNGRLKLNTGQDKDTATVMLIKEKGMPWVTGTLKRQD